MRKHIGSKLIAVFLSFCMVIAFTPSAAFTAYADSTGQNAAVAVNDQNSFNDAVAAANAGDVVEIATAGEYKIPNLPNNITVKATVDGVVFDCVGSGSIASVPNGATFENVTMNFGASDYHGFQHAGTINMNGCTLNGKFFSYGDMNFNGCTFNAPGSDYSMWAYGMDITYTDCTFNGAGKFINVYNEGGNFYSIKAEGCTFNSTKVNKAAFNVKETCGSTVLNRSVEINNCTCNENFPAANEDGRLKVLSPLVQVDDIILEGTPAGGEVEVTLDGEKVYSSEKKFAADENGVYHIATAEQLVKFAGLVNSGTAAASGAVLDADIDMEGVDFTPIGTSSRAFGGTFDGNGKTISNLSVSTEGGYSGLFGRVQGTETLAVIKNLTIKDSEANTTWKNDDDANYVGMIAGHMYAKVENCTVSNCSVEGKDQVGGITGFIFGGNIENCTVENTEINANGDRAGGIAGKSQANDNCKINGNTVDTCTVSAAKTYKGLGSAAALVGQIMPGPKSFITNNNVIDTETVTESDDTFNPIGYFRDFDANAITNGNIAGNSWAPMTTPNSFKMVNPADTTQYIVVKNANQPKVAKIGDTEYTSLQDALKDAVAAKEAAKVEIISDIDLSDDDWTPVDLSGKKATVTVEGNDHVITGMNDMLFGTAWASKGLVIKNLTIKDSNIVNDENDSKGTVGVGAFVGYVEATETVTLDNCHVIDSVVKGGHWVGGLVGVCGGYNGNDGPVFTTLTITGSSVEGCEISGKGSAGSFIGHGATNAATKVILDGEAKDNSISGGKAEKTGKLIGTIGACGPEAFNGESGAIELDVVESGNTGATNVAGRIGTNGGTMIVTGGSYESDPLVTSDNAIGTLAAKEGFTIIENNGVYAVVEKGAQVGNKVYSSLEEAVAAAEAGDTVTLLADLAGNGIKIDKDLTIDFAGYTYTVDGELAGSAGTKTQGFQLLKDNNVTFKNGTVTSEKAKMLVQNYSNLTLDNMVLDGSSLAGTAPYTLSTNNGNTVVKDTKLVAKDGGFAFDVCSFGSYEANKVTVEGESVVEGKVELSSSNDVAVALDLQGGDFSKAELVVSEGGETAEVTKADSVKFAAPDGYAWDEGKLVAVKDLKDQIAELEGQIEDLNDQVKDITDQLESANADKEQLTKELEEVTAAKEELETELADLQAKLTEAEGDNADLQARLDQAAEDIAALEKSVEDANKAIADKDSTIESLTAQVDKLIDLTATLTDTNKGLTDTVKEKTEQVEKLNKDITALNEQIADITDQLEDANADKEQLTKELSDVTAAKEKAEADLKAAKDELTAAEAGIEELQEQLKDEKTKVAELQKQLDVAEGDNADIQAALEKAEEDIEALEKEAADAKTALENTKNELSEAQKAIADLEKSVEDAKNTIADKDSTIAELKDLVKTLTDSTGTLSKEIADLTATVAEKTKQIEDITAELNKANTDKEQLNKDLEAAKAELNTAKGELGQVKEALEAKKKEAEELQSKLDAAEGDKAEIQKQLDEAKDNLEAVETELASTKTALDSANSELSAAQKEIEELKAKLAEKVVPIKYVTIKGIKAKTYTGKKRYQKPVLTFCGKTLVKGVDYTVKYTNNTKVGKTTVVFTGIGEDFKGTVKKTFKINPKKTSIVKVTGAKKAFTVKWKKKTVQTSGYQVRYSLKSNMSKAKIKTVKGTKTVSKKISKLTAKKKYYVQVRTYKTVNGKKYYSSWSAKKSVTTK